MSRISKIKLSSKDEENFIIEALAKYRLSQTPTSTSIDTYMDTDMDTPPKCSVRAIIDHRIVGLDYHFLVDFGGKNLVDTEWLADSDCNNCEEQVTDYLKSNDIQSTYIWCRISKSQDMNAVSLSAQASQLQAFANPVGPKHRVKLYQVTGSAYKSIPSALLSIGRAVNSGDQIVFYRPDRLSRNIVKSLPWIQELDDRGVLIRSFVDNLLYSNDKMRFIQGILDATKESELIGSRVKMGIQARRDRGDTAFGQAPYGKKRVRMPDGHLEFAYDEAEMAVVREIVVVYRKGPRYGNGRLDPSFLNDKGCRKRGKLWTRQSIIAIGRRYVDYIENEQKLASKKVGKTAK